MCSRVEISSESTPEHSGIYSSTPECSGILGLTACPWFQQFLLENNQAYAYEPKSQTPVDCKLAGLDFRASLELWHIGFFEPDPVCRLGLPIQYLSLCFSSHRSQWVLRRATLGFDCLASNTNQLCTCSMDTLGGNLSQKTWNLLETKKLAVFERLWRLKIWRCFWNVTGSWILLAILFKSDTSLPGPTYHCGCQPLFCSCKPVVYICKFTCFFSGGGWWCGQLLLGNGIPTRIDWWTMNTSQNVQWHYMCWPFGRKCTIINIHSRERHL